MFPFTKFFLDDTELEELQANSQLDPSDNDYNDTVRETFIDGSGQVYEDVKLRFLGSQQDRRQIKPGWKVEFNDGDTFAGVNELNLNALFHPEAPDKRGDAGLYERTAWEIFRRVGVPSIQTQTVRLYVNESVQGAFLQREDIEEDFLTRIGKDPDSDLFASEGNPHRVSLHPWR